MSSNLAAAAAKAAPAPTCGDCATPLEPDHEPMAPPSLHCPRCRADIPVNNRRRIILRAVDACGV